MTDRLVGVALFALVIGACQQSAVDSPSPVGPSATSSQAAASAPGAPAGTGTATAQAAASGERPWKASIVWTVEDIRWAGEPGKVTSDFDGRCSVPSDYVIRARFEGEATHAGRVTGTTEHCSQITWSPQGPAGATYSNGVGSVVSANGSTLAMEYGNGTTGADLATGELWFHDVWTFTGGTGLFDGATGSGEEGGTFMDFNALLAGAPVSMWMEGTITYQPGKKK